MNSKSNEQRKVNILLYVQSLVVWLIDEYNNKNENEN